VIADRPPAPARRVLTGAALVAAALAAPAPAAGHTAVERLEPADGAALRSAPAQVRVTYGAPLASVVSAQVLLGGRNVARAARIDPSDARRVVIPLDAAGAGAYRVSWTVVGADGHSLAGRAAFRVRPAGVVGAAHRVGASLLTAARALERAAARATAA